MARTRVFRSGNSQAVRLPLGFRLQGPEVEIIRRGDEIVLREIGEQGLSRAFALIAQLPIDDGIREFDNLKVGSVAWDRRGAEV